MPFEERKVVLENISCVDRVISFEDDDLGSCINALKLPPKPTNDSIELNCPSHAPRSLNASVCSA